MSGCSSRWAWLPRGLEHRVDPVKSTSHGAIAAREKKASRRGKTTHLPWGRLAPSIAPYPIGRSSPHFTFEVPREEASLLKPATFRMLHTPPSGGHYACGWDVAARSWGGGGRTLWHAGSNSYWYATISLAPARDFAMLVAVNQGGAAATKACEEAAAELIESRGCLTR